MKAAITADFIARHDRPGPRYTSYPTADRFGDFAAEDFAKALQRADAAGADTPLALYIHLPFCEQLCTYCGCAVVVTRSAGKRGSYLEYVRRELQLVGESLKQRRTLAQLHLGGGTPNSYTVPELGKLLEAVQEVFTFADGAELAIEIDPRRANPEQITGLYELGFNRLSMGVQDFDVAVQEAIRRVQSFELTSACARAAREAGFESVNMDLVYGLPHQTDASFAETLDRAIELKPDRVALYSFAYVPWIRKHQRAIDPDALPQGDAKLNLFLAARRAFMNAGYVPIGMDHFARPDDELALALGNRRLCRNFQGYTTIADLDVLGVGMTAISDIGGAYVQNTKELTDYQARIDAGQLATARGLERTTADGVRRWLIHQLMCNFHVDGRELWMRFGLELRDDFADELEALKPLQEEGLVEVGEDSITVTPLGELLVRVVAMPFDTYLGSGDASAPRYSRTV